MDRVLIYTGMILMVSLLSVSCTTEEKRYQVAFYNLENLFDTIDTRGVRDTEFTPEGDKEWDTRRYEKKLNNMASVIYSMAEEVEAPAIVGLCEMENRDVLEDLVNTSPLNDFDYRIVHEDSPDRRGIDVALIYRPELFRVNDSQSVPLIIEDENGERIYTRDQLVVSGLLDGEEIHFVVNHWPSRYGGRERSEPFRRAAARLSRSIVDSIQEIDDGADVVVMGDLNDDPDDASVQDYLKAGVMPQPLESDSLYNPLASMFFEGKGTLCYRGVWNMFDQIILTPGLLHEQKGSLCFEEAGVFDEEFLRQQEGDYKGYPFRTFVGDWYHGGYSDHFPSWVVLEKEKKGFFLFP
ncbi:MAG: endonuclease/exonuclease/phosphatase family protein [Marinilabiliaceae bacterium]